MIRTFQWFGAAALAMVCGLAAAEVADPVITASQIQGAKTGQLLADGYVVKAVTPAWTAVECENRSSGEILFVGADGKTTRIKKVLGTVGPHSDPTPVVKYPEAFWAQFLKQKDDFLGKDYLAKKQAENTDPTFAEIEKIVPPMLYPETTVGMNSIPHTVSVSASGAVSLDIGLISGVELSSKCHFFQSLKFLLDGREPTAQECEANINRRLLAGWLPATDFRYRMADRPVGWEQAVLMGNWQGRPGLFIRFRIVNRDATGRTVSFAIAPPEGGRFEQTPEGLTVFAPKTPFFHPKITFAKDPARTAEYLKTFSVPLWRVPFSTSVPCTLDGGKPSWKFELAANGSRDLCLFYPGGQQGKLTRLPDRETETAFYAALREQYDAWNSYLANAAQITIPEPGMEDVFRATLCRILTTAHGDKFEGGVHYYRGFWPFTHLHGVRMMTAAGLFDKSRASLAWFMDTRILPNGVFLFDGGQTRYQLFDIGEFLQALSEYSLASGDTSLITDRQEVIGRLYKLLRTNRAQSLAKFPAGDPRRGMFLSSFENDVPEQDYYYTSDVHAWFGLRDYAAVLRRLAASEKGRGLEQAA